MSNCTHRKESKSGDSVYCRLVKIGVPISADPCRQCQSEWINGIQPAEATSTPTLVSMADAMKRNKPALPTPKPPKKTPPSLLRRIRTAAKAYWQFLKSGKKPLSTAEQSQRLSVCSGCEHRGQHKIFDVCNLCGCLLKWKAALPGERCPLGKWPGDPTSGCGSCGEK